MNNGDLKDFATRYAAAWSGRDPVKFAELSDGMVRAEHTLMPPRDLTRLASFALFDSSAVQRKLPGCGDSPASRLHFPEARSTPAINLIVAPHGAGLQSAGTAITFDDNEISPG